MFLRKLQDWILRHGDYVLMAFAFAIWLFCFRKFFAWDVAFSSDAVSYFEHTQYYLESLLQGSFPMWDHTWNSGAPNDFFLIRIGFANPFFLIPLALKAMGIPILAAYVTFLVSYFFIGMIGFYLLLRELLQHRQAALVGFFLLLSSSLGTRIIDSYMLLITIPLIWFFFFVVKFFKTYSRCAFWGILFTAMLLMTTYIPFFYVTIVMFFVVSYVLVYPDTILSIGVNFFGFAKKNILPIVFAGVCLAGALLPGYFFFKDSNDAVVMPLRNAGAVEESHVLAVSQLKSSGWTLMEDLWFSTFFLHDGRMKLAVVFVSVFSLIILALALITRFRRRYAFYLLLGLSVLMMSVPAANGFYQFLFEKVFFFKYFRNLHFFLWFLLLPLFVVFAAEQFKNFMEYIDKRADKKLLLFVWVAVVHGLFLFWLGHQPYTMVSGLVTVVVSFIYFTVCVWKKNYVLTLISSTGFALIVVWIQPLEFYHFLMQNAPAKEVAYHYERDYQNFQFKDPKNKLSLEDLNRPGFVSAQPVYYAGKYFSQLRSLVDERVARHYDYYNLKLYDHYQKTRDDEINLELFSRTMKNIDNMVFISAPQAENVTELSSGPEKATLIDKDSSEIKVETFLPDKVVFQTNLSTPKVLVYGDVYDKRWSVTIDGELKPLWRANLAYKAVKVPAGVHEVVFQYHAGSRFYVRLLLLITTWLALVMLVLSWRKESI